MTQVLNTRMTAKLEDDFVVFLIGMRINKLWKLHRWLPVAKAMPKMLHELEQKKDLGLLGYHMQLGFPHILSIQYWRSFEHLAAYAGNRDASHFPAWVAFNKTIGSNGDVGIWHETYSITAGHYESVYSNMPAFGLGKAGWLVSATGRASTAAGRIQAIRKEENAQVE